MSKNKYAIKLIRSIILFALLLSQPALSASFGKPYQADKSTGTYYSRSVNEDEMLPSEQTLLEIQGGANSTQLFVVLGGTEDPFDEGANTDDPNAYNDAPLGNGLNGLFLLALCYAIFCWRRRVRTKLHS